MAFKEGVKKISFREFVQFMEDIAFNKKLLLKDEDGERNYMFTFFDFIERIINNKTENGIINCPPRVGKSRYLGIYFIAYVMGIKSNSNFLYLHENEKLATSQAREIVRIMENTNYKQIFTTRLKNNAWAMIKTTDGGQIRTGSIDSGYTGFGAGVFDQEKEFGGAIIFDEPHMAGDAYLRTKLNECYKKFMSEIISRRNHTTVPFIIIGHRVSTLDIFAQLMTKENMDRFKWHIIKIPAINQNGKSINANTLSIDQLTAIRKTTPDVFAAQYMQEPTEGADCVINPDEIRIMTEEDEENCLNIQDGKDILIAVDPNGSSKTSADETGIVVAKCFYFKGDLRAKVPCIKIIEASSSKLLSFEMICIAVRDSILKYQDRLKAIFIEKHTHGGALEEMIREYAKPKYVGGASQINISISSIRSTTRSINKRLFMQRCANYIYKYVYLKKENHELLFKKLYNEIRTITMADDYAKDDITDALCEIVHQLYVECAVSFKNPNSIDLINKKRYSPNSVII
jgi:hypothetical protein